MSYILVHFNNTLAIDYDFLIALLHTAVVCSK